MKKIRINHSSTASKAISRTKLDPELFSWLDSIQAKYSPAIIKLGNPLLSHLKKTAKTVFQARGLGQSLDNLQREDIYAD